MNYYTTDLLEISNWWLVRRFKTDCTLFLVTFPPMRWKEIAFINCSQSLSDSLNQKELEKLCPVYPPLTLPNIRAAIAPMLQLPPEELTRLLFNLSRKELLVWFGDVSWREDTLREGRREKVENFLRVRFGSLCGSYALKSFQ